MLLTYFWVWVFSAGISGAVQIINPIEEWLENVPTSVVSSDNDPVVPDLVVEIEMASLPPPA
jgi:hypothetical protein